MRYDVIIIGAGPGGIFSAYELTKQAPDLKVAVFEAGHELKRRKCPIDGTKIKSCVGCDSCSIMSGFGGAGAFSDGKYNITNDFGGSLYEYIGKNEAIDLMKYVDDINMEYGGEGTKLYSTAGTRFKTVCLQNRLHLLDASVRHLGTDINYIVLENLYAYLQDKVDFQNAVIRLMLHNPLVYIRSQIGAWLHISNAFQYERTLDYAANIFKNLYVPTAWLIGLWVYLLIKKQWCYWFITSGQLCHMAITTALLPAAYFKYYYSEYMYAALTATLAVCFLVKRRREKKKAEV